MDYKKQTYSGSRYYEVQLANRETRFFEKPGFSGVPHYRGNRCIFIQFDEALCLPLEGYLPKSAITLMISLCKQGFAARQKLARLGVHDSYTRAILPAYRVFHRTRIKDFPVYKIEEYSL